MNKHVLRTQQKKEDILNATINLVGTNPLEHITVEKIKKAARVSQVTMYKLFGSKDNLINIAIKEFAEKSINVVMEVLNSDTNPRDRLKGYFRASFNLAITYPNQREIIEYVFSGVNPDLNTYVFNLYLKTYPALERLYNDIKKENHIRSEISFEQFLKMCDMFTRTQPQFYQTSEEMELLLESLVRSFG